MCKISTIMRKEIREERVEENSPNLDQDVKEEERKRLVSLVVLEMAFRTHMQEERKRERRRKKRVAAAVTLEMKEEEMNGMAGLSLKYGVKEEMSRMPILSEMREM
ncbi:hypothetical protein AAC387_Pa12g0559 [Persea americana]